MRTRGAGKAGFLSAVQAGVREQAGKALAPLVKRWRYTQSSDHAALPLQPGSARFLIRYGALDAGKDPAELLEGYHQFLSQLSRLSGEAPGLAAAWLELFASGAAGVLEQGICAREPRCALCPLQGLSLIHI